MIYASCHALYRPPQLAASFGLVCLSIAEFAVLIRELLPRREFQLVHAWGRFMTADEYRRNAAECLSIADDHTITPQRKALLIAMAQSWLRLARQAEKNLTTDLVYEAPPPPERSVLQQQQIQPEEE